MQKNIFGKDEFCFGNRRVTQ